MIGYSPASASGNNLPDPEFRAPPWFADRLLDYASRYGIPLTPQAASLLTRHALWVAYWNRKTNLTGLISWEEMLFHHYLDCLIPLSRLSPGKSALDVGSGAGFPGIPAKVLYPEMHVVLCDKKRKKTSFLKTFIACARLQNVSVVQGEWETLIKGDGHREDSLPGVYDLVMSRAVKFTDRDLSVILEKGLTEKGIVALWTTPRAVDRYLGNLSFAFEIKEYRLPDGLERAVFIVKKT